MKQITGSILYLCTLLALSVFVFDPTHLYYELWWLDIPMHIMGGFGVASLFISYIAYKEKKLSFVQMMLFYLCIAVTWELYEYVHDLMRVVSWNGWEDTISDVFNGAFGATVAYFLIKK